MKAKKYLITGRAGSGKTTVQGELKKRGFTALDTDDIKLAQWEDLATGERLKIDPAGFVDYSKVGWNWDELELRKLLAKSVELFLCGSASNQLKFHQQFTKVFVLTVSPEIQIQRLRSRQSHYGKNQRMREIIVGEQQTFVSEAIKLGAIAINSQQPIEKVVDEILAYVK